MPIEQQRPDGSWGPAEPLPYHPSYDIEWYTGVDRHWVLYRTWPHHLPGRSGGSTEVARGYTRLGLIFAYTWRRLLRPVR